MTFVCSSCPLQLIGPPDLDGTPCPECSDGELGAVGHAPIEDVLAVNGWAEAPDVVYAGTFETFEYLDELRALEVQP